MLKKRYSVIVIVVVAIIAIAAVYSFQYNILPEEKILIVGTTDTPIYVDPALAVDIFADGIIHSCYDTLLSVNPQTHEIEPHLADLPKILDNGYTLEYNLKRGVKFHDGTPFNASAVKFSLDRAMMPEFGLGYMIGDIKEVKIVDTYTVRIILHKPLAPRLAQVLTGTITLTSFVSPTYFANHPINSSCYIGTGPFRLVKWERDDFIELEANKDYFLESPKVDKVIFKFYKDSSLMRLAIEKGEIDVAFRSIEVSDFESLDENPDINMIVGKSAWLRFIGLNTARLPKEVRQAIAYSIDYDAILNMVFYGFANRSYTVVPRDNPGYLEYFKKYQLNITKAKELLAEAGYANGLSLTLWYSPIKFGATENDIALIIQQSCREAGIDIELKPTEWAVLWDTVTTGGTDMSMSGWMPPYPDPQTNLKELFHGEGYMAPRAWFYNNTEVNALIDAAQVEVDPAKRALLFEGIQEIEGEDVVLIPTYWYPYVNFARKNVRGWDLPLGDVHFAWPLQTVDKD